MITKENLMLFSTCLAENDDILIGYDKESIYHWIMNDFKTRERYESWNDLLKVSIELTEFMEKVYPLISDKTEE